MELYGQELTTLNGTRTYDVQNVQPNGSTLTTTMSEPFFVKGICKTASIISYSNTLSGGIVGNPPEEANFTVIYARTANGFDISVGNSVAWELVALRTTPYGEGYKTEANYRSVPTDMFQAT